MLRRRRRRRACSTRRPVAVAAVPELVTRMSLWRTRTPWASCSHTPVFFGRKRAVPSSCQCGLTNWIAPFGSLQLSCERLPTSAVNRFRLPSRKSKPSNVRSRLAYLNRPRTKPKKRKPRRRALSNSGHASVCSSTLLSVSTIVPRWRCELACYGAGARPGDDGFQLSGAARVGCSAVMDCYARYLTDHRVWHGAGRQRTYERWVACLVVSLKNI